MPIQPSVTSALSLIENDKSKQLSLSLDGKAIGLDQYVSRAGKSTPLIPLSSASFFPHNKPRKTTLNVSRITKPTHPHPLYRNSRQNLHRHRPGPKRPLPLPTNLITNPALDPTRSQAHHQQHLQNPRGHGEASGRFRRSCTTAVQCPAPLCRVAVRAAGWAEDREVGGPEGGWHVG